MNSKHIKTSTGALFTLIIFANKLKCPAKAVVTDKAIKGVEFSSSTKTQIMSESSLAPVTQKEPQTA